MKKITNVNNLPKLTEEENEVLKLLENKYDNFLNGKIEIQKFYNEIGEIMKNNLENYNNIHIHPFETPSELHGKVSRIIYKLRNTETNNNEFIYYIQKGFEILFELAYTSKTKKRIYKTIKTPLDMAIHKIPDVENFYNNSIMCVLLRGALLPSIIMSKEMEEYSLNNYKTPFALFKISRNDNKQEKNMEYILDLNKSFFNKNELEGKDLIFADPMNATAGSLFSIIKYLEEENINYKSIKVFNIITSYKGALRISKLKNVELYSLWVDPIMNEKAYILPGLGDAGDRINGIDNFKDRNIIQLIMDYGSNITSLYRDQIEIIEKMILG